MKSIRLLLYFVNDYSCELKSKEFVNQQKNGKQTLSF